MSKQAHPHWEVPKPNLNKNLFVYNSLTSQKNPFYSLNENIINWYACGPTVYSSAHLGHARAYMTFDIIRRILGEYFHYDINYVMNITDIDDKIILKARRNFLLEAYLEKNEKSNLERKFKSAIEESVGNALGKLEELEEKLKLADERQKSEIEQVIKGEKVKLKSVRKMKSFSIKKLIETSQSRDVLSESLDRESGEREIDFSIFKKHSKKFEEEFFEDMKVLRTISKNKK
ncbi:hypothetical protein MHBO_003371 [Bonamia ostreae]|uniref:tRNA synthetases class I catalytic domain-containing protein n=1 Tax=Bonamia ostreae TaxID=126728 RepID=A0ABV2AQL2_9EUKA